MEKENIQFSEHYSTFWSSVQDKVDEEGWVYEREVSHILDYYFVNQTGLEIDFQKSSSFLSGDNPNWLTRGARWRPKSISISLLYKIN